MQSHLKGCILYLGLNTPVIYIWTDSSAVIWTTGQRGQTTRQSLASESHSVNILWIFPHHPSARGSPICTDRLFTCCNLSATLKRCMTASLHCECHRRSEGILGTRFCSKNEAMLTVLHKHIKLHMCRNVIRTRGLFICLLIISFSLPFWCPSFPLLLPKLPFSSLLSPTSMSRQVRGCLVYKTPE